MSKFLALIVLSIAMYQPAFGQQTPHPPSPEEAALTKAIVTVLQAVHELKPGMTREDVLRNFTTEGGLSARSSNHFVYRGCPYIKIDVTFAIPSGEDQTVTDGADKIATVSRPYLEYSIVD
jgi:hypothetical protein